VPAVAVRHGGQALFGVIRCKKSVGGICLVILKSERDPLLIDSF